MAKLSVPQAAERLGVSPARVRQRIEDGSLVAEKIGGRWLVDLDASQPAPQQLGRPVMPSSVWWSLVSAEIAKAALPNLAARSAASEVQKSLKPVVDAALRRKLAMPALKVAALKKPLVPMPTVNVPKVNVPSVNAKALQAVRPAIDAAAFRDSLLPRMRLAELILANVANDAESSEDDHAGSVDDLDVLAPGFLDEALSLSRSSRSRAINRFVQAVVARDYAALLSWLSHRGSRQLFVVAAPDLNGLRADERLRLSGVSHSRSGMEDPRIVEAYVSAGDLESIVNDYWLEKPVVDERPNVVLHVVPVRPPEVGPMLLAADLAEHGGPREVQRAHELLDEAIDALVEEHAQASESSA